MRNDTRDLCFRNRLKVSFTASSWAGSLRAKMLEHSPASSRKARCDEISLTKNCALSMDLILYFKVRCKLSGSCWGLGETLSTPRRCGKVTGGLHCGSPGFRRPSVPKPRRNPMFCPKWKSSHSSILGFRACGAKDPCMRRASS
jgi:hypothetical protein